MTIHHATAKRAIANNVVLTANEDGTFSANGHISNTAKAALDAAIEAKAFETHKETYEIERTAYEAQESIADVAQEMAEDAAFAETVEDNDEEDELIRRRGSVVHPSYKIRYAKATRAPNSNDDDLAEALYAACTGKDGKLDLNSLLDIAGENSVNAAPYSMRNPGHQRMIIGNILRGRFKRGEKVMIAGQVFQMAGE